MEPMQKEIDRRFLKGIAASLGIVIGKAYIFQDMLLLVKRQSVEEGRSEKEITRLHQAIRQVVYELMEDNFQISMRMRKQEAEIFLTHIAILKDPYFIAQIDQDIRENGVNAESAVMGRVRESLEAPVLRITIMDGWKINRRSEGRKMKSKQAKALAAICACRPSCDKRKTGKTIRIQMGQAGRRHLDAALWGQLCMRTPNIGAIFLLFLSCFGLTDAIGSESALTVGYGFGIGNGSGVGRLENGRYYDFAQMSYVYERPLTKRFILGLEPFVNIDSKPNGGLDIGCTAQIKSYWHRGSPTGLYLTAGAGGAYTTIKFPKQGSHTPFILLAGIGFRHDRIFIENRFFQYSNGGLVRPNRSVNANIVRIGYYF